jgi:hypothetical protein
MKRILTVAFLAASLWLFNCGGGDDGELVPLETQTAALNASENVKNNIMDLSNVLQFLEDSKLMADAFGMFGETEEVCTPVPAPGPGEEPDEFAEPECWEEEGDGELEIDFTEIAEDIANWLNDYVFTEAQVESDSGKTIVYLLNPQTFCDQGGEGEELEDEEWVDEGDTECEDFLTQVPVRVKVVSYEEGDIDVDLLFGTEQFAPIHLQLHQSLLAAEVDLAEVRNVAQLLIDFFDDEEFEASLPTKFSGKVKVSLEKLDANRFELTYAVTEAVEVGLDIDGSSYEFSLGKSTLSMLADKAAESLSVEAKIGAFDASFPYQDFINAMWEDDEDDWDDEYVEVPPDEKPAEPDQPFDDIMDDESEVPQVTGTMAVHVAGFTGAATFTGTDDSVAFTGLGLGDGTSTLKRNGTTLLAIDINKDAGRAFDLTLAAEGEDTVLTVAPEFDFALLIAFASVQGDFEELPGFMLDETFSVTLGGAPAPAIRMVEEVEGIKVEEGTLTLASTAAPEETVVVEAGQCLFGVEDEGDETYPVDGEEPMPAEEEEEEGGHELLSAFEVGACE